MSKPGSQESQNEHAISRTDTSITDEHRSYLIRRHGTIDLEPFPCYTDDDPLNWPKRKKVTSLFLVAFHAMMATFTAAAIQSAFVDIAADLHVSVHKASYLSSLVIIVLGVGPLLWSPLAHAYGRRPIFLNTLLCSLIGNIGCAVSPSYGTQVLCRTITAFFISPAAGFGSAVVSECFFRHERARYMGVWTIMITLGVPLAPLIFGFVAMRVGYRWIYWTLAITNGVQFLTHAIFGPETRFVQSSHQSHNVTFKKQYFSFRRIDPAPLTINNFVHPLKYARNPNIFISAAVYAMIFLFGSVLTTFEIPQIFPEKFGFNTQQVGLQNIGIIIGTVIGEQCGGFASDKWMWLREKKGSRPELEFRLWLGYIGHGLTICGLVVFLVQIENASDHWNVTPIVGAGIAAAGNQVVTTIMVTYCVDCNPPDAAAIGVFITLVRQVWGFIGPFWIPIMIENLGLIKSVGVVVGMIVAVSILPTILLQWKGQSWRSRVG